VICLNHKMLTFLPLCLMLSNVHIRCPDFKKEGLEVSGTPGVRGSAGVQDYRFSAELYLFLPD
jgi:hypothetical protein